MRLSGRALEVAQGRCAIGGAEIIPPRSLPRLLTVSGSFLVE